MIHIQDAQVGRKVFYQRPEMNHPEYGIISGIGETERHRLVQVQFFGEPVSKPCYLWHLYWPPNFVKIDGGHVDGQLYSKEGEYPRVGQASFEA